MPSLDQWRWTTSMIAKRTLISLSLVLSSLPRFFPGHFSLLYIPPHDESNSERASSLKSTTNDLFLTLVSPVPFCKPHAPTSGSVTLFLTQAGPAPSLSSPSLPFFYGRQKCFVPYLLLYRFPKLYQFEPKGRFSNSPLPPTLFPNLPFLFFLLYHFLHPNFRSSPFWERAREGGDDN